MLKKLKEFKWGYVILFLILSCIGVLCIVFPDALRIVCIVSGAILSLYAAVLFTVTLVKRERSVAFAIKITVSAIALAAGLVTAILNRQSVGVLTSLLGLYMVIDGSFKLQTTILSKRYRVAAWWIMLSLSILIIGGGFVSIKWAPTEDNMAWSSGILGATLIVDGIANLLTAFFTTAYEKRMVEDIKSELREAENETSDTQSDNAQEDESSAVLITLDPENVAPKEEIK